MAREDMNVAVVTGASRGLGRGIARAFGARGMTVYLTGRNDDGSLDAAAREVDGCGGRGIAVRCDHRDDDQVAAFVDRVKREQGRVDILVNNAAAVFRDDLRAPGGFWEKPLQLCQMIDVGLRSSYVATYHVVPMMVAAGCGLIVNISFFGAVSYFMGPAYGAAKAGVDKMSHDMAIDLSPHGVAVVSLWPGYILTDALRDMPSESLADDMRARLALFEHPEFSGEVIAALARDPDLMTMSGRTLIGAELGERYGIVDRDGKPPRSFRSLMGSPDNRFRPPNAP